MRETWKSVVGYEGRYSVSNLGRVRRDLTSPGARAGKILRSRYDKDGYEQVMLHAGDGGRDRKVHQLVLAAFVGPRPKGHEVNHRDGGKANNVLLNLEYVTHRDNIDHARRILKRSFRPPLKRGSEAPLAKLDEGRVRRLRKKAAAGVSTSQLATEFGISTGNVRKIVRRNTWKHVS